MAIDFYSGMVPTADELLMLAPLLVTQGSAHSVISSIALVDSALIVPVNGPAEIDLSARYQTGGGGIRWAWEVTGTVSMSARDVMSSGSGTSTTDGTANIADLRWRQIATLDEEQTVANYNNASTHLIRERCLVDGVGELVFKFAQQASNAGATVLHQNSYAISTPIRT